MKKETTTVEVEVETSKHLNLLKYAMGVRSVDDVIRRLIVQYRASQQRRRARLMNAIPPVEIKEEPTQEQIKNMEKEKNV